MTTPKQFYESNNGKRYNKGDGWNDSGYGYQCVAGFKHFCEALGIPVKATPNNNAGGYWLYRDTLGFSKWFEYITSPSQFKDGDWVIWLYGSGSHPKSHIAMYYRNYSFGQNQGGDCSFCLKTTTWTDAAGALRPKAWNKEAMPYGFSKLIRDGITAYVYRGNNKAGYGLHVLSANGQTALKDIAEFDSESIVKAAVVNAGYFQMQEGKADPYGTHYGIEQDAAAGNSHTQAPKQDGLLAFYEDKNGFVTVGNASDYYGTAEEVNFCITPYAVRIHEGKKTFFRSTAYGDKDDVKTQQTAAVKFENGDWAVAVFPGDICPRDTVTFFDNFADVQELILMDSGGSSQMRAWNESTKTMESKLYTGRKLPNVLTIAKIADVQTEPEPGELEPIDIPVEIEPEPAEEKEDEETSMDDEKTAENTPVKDESWSDPEPQTNVIVDRIASLLSVKSILTIALTVVFAYLVMKQLEIPEFFSDIYKIVILFFFGYQTGKAEKK